MSETIITYGGHPNNEIASSNGLDRRCGGTRIANPSPTEIPINRTPSTGRRNINVVEEKTIAPALLNDPRLRLSAAVVAEVLSEAYVYSTHLPVTVL